MSKNSSNSQINQDLQVLAFSGPYTFSKGEQYLFDSEFLQSEGIYIWTIKNELHGVNHVHYIGETTSFGKRHREHLIQITGLNYRILEAESARKGMERVVWNGLWRDRSNKAVSILLENYTRLSGAVVEYVDLINVYFAPTTLSQNLRRHIEGSLGANLRSQPALTVFYPDDNRLSTSKQKLGLKVVVNLPEPIAGIGPELEI